MPQACALETMNVYEDSQLDDERILQCKFLNTELRMIIKDDGSYSHYISQH